MQRRLFREADGAVLVWFEESGHEPPVEEAVKFKALMAEPVRPVVA